MRTIDLENYCAAHAIACAQVRGDYVHAQLIRATSGLSLPPRLVIQLWDSFTAMKYRMPSGGENRLLESLELSNEGDVRPIYIDLSVLEESKSPALG